jgi:ATP-dependent DNA helicase RecG
VPTWRCLSKKAWLLNLKATELSADRDLLAAVISLANTEGGELYLGVEDNMEITGLHPRHRDITMLAALIGNKSCPPLSVRAELRCSVVKT